MQTTSHILMVRPAAFGYNAQTAVNNAFQVLSSQINVHEQALQEFDAFVDVLRANGIHVIVVQDSPEPHTPDAIFPNNWVSFHEDGTVILYPMFASNRRIERTKNIWPLIHDQFTITNKIDLTYFESNHTFLEGTGSIVLDRKNKIAYACISPRTDTNALATFCKRTGFTAITFNANDANKQAIYHTNVMMCVADEFVVICLESIVNTAQKQKVVDSITQTSKVIIDISLQQMHRFAGNMLQLKNDAGQKFLVMSTQAYQSLTQEQLLVLESFNTIIHSPLYTIEQNGGGSARCMMAEIFLPPK